MTEASGKRLHFVVAIVVVLFAREASAQVGVGHTAQMAPIQAEIAAQATVDTSYLLALYMTQLAAAGAAPTQADIDEATRQYFTNGAAATGVPTSGPGAEYFTNGAAATGVPTSGPWAAYFTNGAAVTAYSPSPVTLSPEATRESRPAVVGGESHEEDAGMPHVAPTSEGAAIALSPPQPSEVEGGAPAATGLTCSPLEIQAAMAIARQFATKAAAPLPATSCPPSTILPSVPPVVVEPPALAAQPTFTSPSCPATPTSTPRLSLLSSIALALSGAFCGGLAVALGARTRPSR
jgi:hypothetical protein